MLGSNLMGREIGPELTYLPVLGFLRGGNVSASCPPPAPGHCFGVVSIWKGRLFHGDTLSRQSVKDKWCYFHLLRWVNCRIFTSSLKSMSNLSFFFLSPCPSSGFLLSFHFWESFLEFSKPFWSTCCVCQALEGGCPCPELEKCLVFSCRCISNFWLFFPLTAALLLSPLCPRGPALLLSPCPTFVLQCCLCGRFLLFREDVCFRLFCLCSLAVGTFLRSLLPFCLSLSSFRGWWKKRPDFWLILDFSGISVLTKGRLHCSLLKSKLKIQWGGGGSFSHPGHGWDF